MDIERLFSEEVEETILGAMIIDINSYMQVNEQKIKGDDFYLDKNKVVFEIAKEVFDEEKTIDLLLLLEKLKEKDLLNKAGGVTRVTEISTSVATTSNLINYIELLKEYSMKRKLIDISRHIQVNIKNSVEDLQQEVSKKLSELVGDEASTDTVERQEEKYLSVLEQRIKGECNALKTGLKDIDDKINGFNGGDLITIFAFSGVGKTALACQIALNAIRQKKRVLFFSLEMPKEQIRDRMISNMASIPFQNIRYGRLEDSEIDKVIRSNSLLANNKGLLISEEDELLNITSKIQLEVMRNNIDIVFIDYINLINISGNKKEEYQRVTECTRVLKKLAKNVNRPIVILAQGKQESAGKMGNKELKIWEKVSVNDIAGGASIYRDSDLVLGMYRNVELDNKLVRDNLVNKDINNINYASKHADKNPQCINVLIKKSRASGKDITTLRWKAENYKISNWC